MVFPIFGHLVVGPSGRALTAWIPPSAAVFLGMTASLHVEGG